MFVPLLLSLSLAAGSGPGAAGYARPELLADTAWLAAHTSDPAVRIVDMRTRGFEAGHIPGAVALANDAIRIPANAPTFLPGAAAFEQLMSRLGISNRTRVVVYDDRGGIYAARLWAVLNAFGHSNVALLDGGWTKWTAEGRAVSTDIPVPPAATFHATLDATWIATASDVLHAIDKPGIRIVDARTQGEIDGRELRGIKRGGFIRSSIPVYWEDALDPATRAFKPAEEIAKLYRGRGIGAGDEVIAYCQVGMRAAHDLFALALIGQTKLRLYLGSWEEWGNRDDLPVERK
jgi:thiosulfate/3-mercaptopyruvate sulfurtransferase